MHKILVTAPRVLAILTFGVSSSAAAQVAFQPPNCEFHAVFVSAPDVSTAAINDDSGKPQSETIANLNVIVDGKPNFFRAECIPATVPTALNEKAILEDMQTVASGNHLQKATAWVEKKPNGEFVGRVRGELTDSVATYILDIRRYFGAKSILDAWVGSPPDTFPSRGNLIFFEELKRDGEPLN